MEASASWSTFSKAATIANNNDDLDQNGDKDHGQPAETNANDGGDFTTRIPMDDPYTKQQQQEEEFPLQGSWMGRSQPPLPPPQQGYYYDTSPPPLGGMQQQRQHQHQQEYPQDPYSMYLQDELHESLNRESALVTQLDNLTTTVVIMEQKEELHTRQLDVLTERVMDVEAAAAEDRTLRLEYEANCTALQASLSGLQEDLENWQDQCRILQQQTVEDQERLAGLHQTVKEKQSEAEELAVAMEQLRLTEKRREAALAAHKPISGVSGGGGGGGGLFSWFWGLLGFGSRSNTNDQYDDETREEAFEMAKSTLLRALQTERANVHELEAVVASLQQNNSAISEMVESRDMIINELNNRIAVFEEDKVVLKAALKQLQKEMQDEAPRTQKLMDDLDMAEQEVNRLKEDMQLIIETHQQELSALQATISQKQQAITETESNLTAIGTYVDKLEERLTSFAVTRRDMEQREKKCKEIERTAEESETQRKTLALQVEDFQKQEEELKKLLEELATERTTLQKDNRKLYTEREFRISEQDQLEARCKTLEEDSKNQVAELQLWKDKCESLTANLEATEQTKVAVGKELETAMAACQNLTSLQSQNEFLERESNKMKEELSSVLREKAELEAKLFNATKAAADAKAIADKIKADANHEAAEATEATGKNTPPPPPPPLSSQSKPNSKKSLTLTSGNSPPKRNVPMRSIRKRLSAATGLHGLITPSSKVNLSPVATSSTPSSKDRPRPPNSRGKKGTPQKLTPIAASMPVSATSSGNTANEKKDGETSPDKMVKRPGLPTIPQLPQINDDDD